MLCAANACEKICTTSNLCSGLLELGGVVVGLLLVAADLEQVGEHRPLREEIKNLQSSKAEAACLRAMNVKRRKRAGSKKASGFNVMCVDGSVYHHRQASTPKLRMGLSLSKGYSVVRLPRS